MKTFFVNINPHLGVYINVKNGKKFSEAMIEGSYRTFEFEPYSEDYAKQIRSFAVKNADDKGVYSKCWHAHCNGYNMDLCVASIFNPTTHEKTIHYTLNTYRPYGRTSK